MFPVAGFPGGGAPEQEAESRRGAPDPGSSSRLQSSCPGPVMAEAVLLDLVLGLCPPCGLAALQEEGAGVARVFLLCGTRYREDTGPVRALLNSCSGARVLDSGSAVDCVFRFKQHLDQLHLSSVRVLTSARGRALLRVYEHQLFTAVYTFDFRDTRTCPECDGPAHTHSPEAAEADVTQFMQQLPALRGDVQVLTSALIPGVFGHGFSTRSGGVSSISTLSSLNLFISSRRRDPVAVVMENRRRLAVHAGFFPRPLHLVKVNHAHHVWVFGDAEPQSYDAMVTDRPGVVLAAPGADCMPLLFADPRSKVIGVAHAGWKGTLMGVAMATVDAMVSRFGCRLTDILVAVGPSVGPCCFTLEKEEALGFLRLDPACVPDPESARPHVDIRLANRLLLQTGGVLPQNIHDDSVTEHPSVTPCTSCHPDSFFSHVRDGPNFGTQVGYLWIRDI